MGVMDAFNAEDRVQLKVGELIAYFRAEARTNAKNELLVNGLRAGLPDKHILIMGGYLGTDTATEE